MRILKAGYVVFVVLVLGLYGATQWRSQTESGGVMRKLVRLFPGAATREPGSWESPPFEAATFGADGGAWQVSPENVQTYSYTHFGKTVGVSFYVTGTTVVGSPRALWLRLPEGDRVADGKRFVNQMLYRDAGGPYRTGSALVLGGAPVLYLFKEGLDALPWMPLSGKTDVMGQITFEIK